MSRNAILFSLGAVSALAMPGILGCNDDDTPASSNPPVRTEPTGGTIVSNEDAVERIAEARCNRAERCQDIGIGRDYESRDACMASVKANTGENLNPSDCTSGVGQKDLDECVSSIQQDDCGNPLDSLGRLVSCVPADLCRD